MTPASSTANALSTGADRDCATDEALALAARKGDARAYGALVDRHEAALTAFLRRRTLIDEDARDLAQDAFVRAWMNLERFDETRSFRVWLYTIAARLSADLARGAVRRHERERALHALGRPACADAAQRAEQREAASRIWRLADETLSEQQRSMLWLRCAEGWSVQQIARALGKSSVAVRVNLHRARAALRKRLEREQRARNPSWARSAAKSAKRDEPALRAAIPAAIGEVHR